MRRESGNSLRFFRQLRRVGLALAIAIVLLSSYWAISTVRDLSAASQRPIDAYLMLGGSIRREVHMVQVAKEHPDIPILISHGADDPCTIRLFEVEEVGGDRVWFERCANSTFENFYYTLAILQQWGVRRVEMVTSPTHLPRAQWLGQIILGSHGIWMDTYTVTEKGIPANRESYLKTGLDVARSLAFAAVSQVYQPSCDNVYRMVNSDLESWIKKGYVCEKPWDLRKVFENMP